LFFSLPAAFPLSPHIRMVEDDISYISLHQVYEDFCNRSGVHKDQAIDFYVKSVEEAMSKRTVYSALRIDLTLQEKDNKDWLNNVKMEIIQAIRQNIVPDTFLLDVQASIILWLIVSSSRGRSPLSLTYGFSANSSPFSTRRLRSKHICSQSTIVIRKNSSSRVPREISGTQKCYHVLSFY
jgi:hypothetical protein